MKYILFIWSSLLYCTNILAQSLTPNVSVDKHTGIGVVNFPLYTVTSGSLSMPVNLLYDAGGLRVDDSGKPYGSFHYDVWGGWKETIGTSNSVAIAAGWRLSVGGMIKRKVRGLPDDLYGIGTDERRGWLHGTGAQTAQNFGSSSDNDLSNCDDEQSDYNILNAIGWNIDTEPDVFTFSFGEFSGKFVFDHTMPSGATFRPIHTIPYQDFKISYSLANNAISEFVITTNTGIEYKFQPTLTIQRENEFEYTDYFTTSYYRNLYQTNYTEEWGLYAVTQPGGQASINLTYSNVREETFSEPQKVIIKTPGQVDQYTEFNATRGIIRKRYSLPVSIRGGSGGVEFNAEGVQFDNNDFRNPIVFKKVEVNGRTFLESVSEVANCLTLAEHKFKYRGVDLIAQNSVLPPTYSNAKDFWGYFNNTSDTQVSYPKIYVYPTLTGADRYRLHPIPGNNNYHLLAGANRDVDVDAITAGTLTNIITPSKGLISIDLESNEYYDQTAAVKFNGSGVRVKKITYHDGISHTNDIVKEYVYDGNGGRLLYPPTFAYAVPMHSQNGTVTYPSQVTGADLYTMFTFRSPTNLTTADIDNPRLIYETVTEKETGKGKTVYQYAMGATNNEISTNDYTAPHNYIATLSKIARLKSNGTCPEYGIIENGYGIFPFPENTNYDFERGQLLNQKMYNESGNLVKEIQFSYHRLTKDVAPYLIKGIKLESHSINYVPVYQYGQYNMLTDVGKAVATQKEIVFDKTNASKKIESSTSCYYGNTSHRLINHIAVTNSAGVVNHTRIKYLGDLSLPSGGSPEVVTFYKMGQRNMYGIPVEQTSSISNPGDVEKLTGATLSIYTEGAHPDYPSLIYYYPLRSMALKIASPISDFSPVTIGPSNNLVFDSRYKTASSYLSWNKNWAFAEEVLDDKRNIHSVIMETPNLKKADIVNARLSEIAFSGFKYADGTSYGNQGATVSPTVTLTKTNISKNPLDQTYTFSCWINSAGAGNLTVTLSDGSNSTNTVIGYADTNGGWKFYQSKIPVASLNATFSALIQSSSSIVLDYHILLYPSSANIKYYTYNMLGIASETDMNGNKVLYDYDMFRRLTHTRDKDNNILTRNTYPVEYTRVISADFHSTNYQLIYDSPKAGMPIYFRANDICTPGTIYTWNFGDGTTQVGESPNHTYLEPGIYTITLTTSHPQYTGTTKSITQTIIRNVNAVICNRTGPVTYSICDQVPTYSPCDPNPTGYPGYNVFTVDASQNTSPSATISYLWEFASPINNIPWTEISGATTNTYQRGVDANEPTNSYQVRCTVTITDTHLNPNMWETPSSIWITTEPISVNFIQPCY